LLIAPRLSPGTVERLERYSDALYRLYRAIQEVSGRSIVVDSSKMTTHALMLHRDRRIDLRVLHLVRDSRGVAFSAAKRVELPTTNGRPTLLPRYGTVPAAARYLVHNSLAHTLRTLGIPYRLLRYEDLIAAPRERLAEVVRHAGGAAWPDELSFLQGDRAQVGTNHLVDGNPVRFSSGPMRIRLDVEWKARMAPSKKAAVTALTWPLLVAYRYPLLPGADAEAVTAGARSGDPGASDAAATTAARSGDPGASDEAATTAARSGDPGASDAAATTAARSADAPPRRS
jgi:hypothetical protein